ncbi:MAG: hypothetical protein KJN69_09800 [Gammaproteobacteria bacterium]|nr:hypothetical protein [Gammaproteobacteria bacterium]
MAEILGVRRAGLTQVLRVVLRLGLAIFQTNLGYDFIQGIVFAIGAGLGLTLALVLMASIRETSELSDFPAIAKGTGLTLIIAGSLSLAFMGFADLL